MMNSFPPRRLVRALSPASEPVSLAEAKTFLRIDSADEDALIGDLIKAARIAAEEQTGKSFITQRWQLSYDSCPPAITYLPNGPVQSIHSVKSVNEEGAATNISASSYHLNALQELVFESVPSGHQVVIEYVAGFGDEATDVPTDLAQAILLHVARLYEHRDAMNPPLGSQLLYASHREIRL